MKYLNFNNLSQKPTKFYRFTGLEVGEFLILKEEIEPLWQESEIKRLFHANRQRAIGSGRKYHLKSLLARRKGILLKLKSLLKEILAKS